MSICPDPLAQRILEAADRVGVSCELYGSAALVESDQVSLMVNLLGEGRCRYHERDAEHVGSCVPLVVLGADQPILRIGGESLAFRLAHAGDPLTDQIVSQLVNDPLAVLCPSQGTSAIAPLPTPTAHSQVEAL